MERELCTQLTTLAVLLLSEADGTDEQPQPKQVTAKGKGKKRAAETGKHFLTSGGTLQQPHTSRSHRCSKINSIPDLQAGDCGMSCLALPPYSQPPHGTMRGVISCDVHHPYR